MPLPESVSINAWCGAAVTGELGAAALNWGVRRQRDTPRKPLAAPEPAPLWNWRHEDVGWGIVLPDNDALGPADRATAADAPAAIRALVEARGAAPVFRYRPELLNRKLRRYTTDGSARDLDLTDSQRGIGDKKLPRYLLIYAPPDVIPWSFQYVLGQSAFVGRLDLTGDGLANYVQALINEWDGAGCQAEQPVVWAVNHGHPDITWLMNGAIAKPLAGRLGADSDIGDRLRLITGAAATVQGLQEQLTERRPALIVTTSHGMTGPLDDIDAMRTNLGLLVDHEYALLEPAALLAHWAPDGAIWYSHACCSAGSDAATSYEGLVAEGSLVARVLNSVAALGAQVAPLPRALLGAAKPLRAFIGQVEPTFDWTLRADTGQVLSNTLLEALYTRMHQKQPQPVGLAFFEVQQHAGQLFSQLDSLRRDVVKAVEGAKEAAIRTQLTALDRQSLVIIGDPTVALPPL